MSKARTQTMGSQFALWIIGLSVLCQGCTTLANVAWFSVVEPAEYCPSATDAADCVHNRTLARDAWRAFQQHHQDHPYSDDFARGFKAGFADYLFAGGTGEPPPVPPRCYWQATYETPEGHQAMHDWFEGFRAGAQIAKESGYRELVTVPSSTSVAHPLPRPSSPPVGTASDLP